MLSQSRTRGRVRSLMARSICGPLAIFLFPQGGLAQTLTLNEALSRVATADPTTIANAANLRAADAAVTQADVRPRDVTGFELEDFAGTGAYSPFQRPQATAWYERKWERGGKRDARVDAARSNIGVTVERNRLRMLDRLALVQAAWVEVLATQASIPVAEQRLAAARRTSAEVDRRVGRALDPLFAAERARTTVAEARIALDQARQAFKVARNNLATWWGGNGDFQVSTDEFTLTTNLPEGPEQAPDLAFVNAERAAADARVRLAEADNVGDPTGRVGLRHFGQGNDVAVMVGGSIPLGSRAANRGNVERARAEEQAAEAEIAVLRVEVRRETDRLIAERALLAVEVSRIDHEVLPSAERALALVRDGFVRGGTAFTFLEINQAQQALVEARALRVDLLRRFHLAGVRLDRLTGRHLPLLASAENR